MNTHYEAPESVKYHGGYDPSDPPQGEHWCSGCSRWDADCDCQFCENCEVLNDPPRDSGLCEKCQATAEWFDELSARGDNAGGGDVCSCPAPSPAPLCDICGAKMVKQSDTYTYCPLEGLFSHRAKPKKSKPILQLDYPVWRMSFSEYGEHMGWEVP